MVRTPQPLLKHNRSTLIIEVILASNEEASSTVSLNFIVPSSVASVIGAVMVTVLVNAWF